MDKNEIESVIEKFMHPSVFTGVKPLFLLAEELAIKEHTGDIVDAVWVDWDNENKIEFSYISKLAVKGKILDRNYHTKEEMEPFKGRLALPDKNNLKKMVLHREIKEEIKVVTSKRDALATFVKKDFSDLTKLLDEGQDIFLFKKGYGDWVDPFYEIDITAPYLVLKSEDKALGKGEYSLKHPKTGVINNYVIENDFFAYIVGPKADISGLELKDVSYKKTIETKKDEAKKMFLSIEWLWLKDPLIKSITEKLPKHPFDNYFKYVKKGDERKFEAPENLVQALERIVAEYMPKLNGPMGVEYIPLDNLLHLFHEVIPRAEALITLEACDIVHEPSAIVLGIEGRHELPPRFLVSINQVVHVYKKFPSFIEACEEYLS